MTKPVTDSEMVNQLPSFPEDAIRFPDLAVFYSKSDFDLFELVGIFQMKCSAMSFQMNKLANKLFQVSTGA